jgi:hypothetical protein
MKINKDIFIYIYSIVGNKEQENISKLTTFIKDFAKVQAIEEEREEQIVIQRTYEYK